MVDENTLEAEAARFKEDFERIRAEVGRIIVGQERVVEATITAILCGGNVLLEGVPGLGKTELVKTLGKALDLEFRRIQFTPDLMPADITGTTVLWEKPTGEREFQFQAGPVFANVVLADEVNRATPKAQSALLESMEEFQVTVDGQTRDLPQPFFVVATENPIEYEGTYHLPEAQLDRFLMRVQIGYPSPPDEVDILSRQILEHPIHRVVPVMTAEEVVVLQGAIRQVHVAEELKEYAVRLTNETRRHPDVELGASPRGSLALMRAGQAIAASGGRDYVLPDDMKRVAHAVLAHRVIVKPERRIRGMTPADVVAAVLSSVEVPVLVV